MTTQVLSIWFSLPPPCDPTVLFVVLHVRVLDCQLTDAIGTTPCRCTGRGFPVVQWGER